MPRHAGGQNRRGTEPIPCRKGAPMNEAWNQQLARWHEENDFQRIIDAIEELPGEERTPDLVSQLARAYNNLARPGDRELFRRAQSLLLSVQEELKDDHNWNFRLGYACYYLDREDQALPLFERALELRPGDADTREFIQMCRDGLALPTMVRPFSRRTADGWQDFLAGEEELRQLIDRGDSGAMVEKCSELLSAAFESVCFELGFNGEKYELILTPEGIRSTLFQLVYFCSHAPEAVGEHWNILIGRQKAQGFGLRMDGHEITPEDVQVLPEIDEGGSVSLTLSCEALNGLPAGNEGMAYNMLSILCDQTLGELAAMRYLTGGFEVVEQAPEGSIPLSRLDDLLRDRFGSGYEQLTPEGICELFVAYRMEPSEGEERYLREDCFFGVTSLAPLVNEYFTGEETIMNEYHANGAVPGFFCLDHAGIPREEVLDLRDQAQQALEAAAGDSVTFIGSASGTEYSYLDFIAWDLRTVLNAAVEVLEQLPYPAALFHSFRRDVGGVTLKSGEE